MDVSAGRMSAEGRLDAGCLREVRDMCQRAFATRRGAAHRAGHTWTQRRQVAADMARLVYVLATAVAAVSAFSACSASQRASTSAVARQVRHIDERTVLPPGAAYSLESIAAGPDGNLWVTYVSNGTDSSGPAGGIARITPAGSVSTFSLPPSSDRLLGLEGIAAGSDGALWFTQTAFVGHTGKIGRITPAGLVTSFPLPAYSNPTGIVAGPDGALWFTDTGRSMIGRITTAGVVTEFGLVTLGSSPQGIVAGPDGALWFTQSWGGTAEAAHGTLALGRITMAGAVAEIPSAVSPGYSPGSITAGRDGNLWFVEQTPLGDGLIGRITPAGSAKTFAIPTAQCRPRGIAAGSDGALWFTEYGADKIGRITTAGVMAEYPLPGAARGPWAIAAGPDGALWVTERDTGKIGRIAA
jgi:virginiamycin B lyase